MNCPNCIQQMWVDILEGDNKVDDIDIAICYGCAQMYQVHGFIDIDETDPDEIRLYLEEVDFWNIFTKEFDENKPTAQHFIMELEKSLTERIRRTNLKRDDDSVS